MTSWIVIDSSTFIASIREEPGTDQAIALLRWIKQQGLEIAAPSLFGYEIASTLRKAVVRNTLSASDGAKLLHQVLEEPISLMVDNLLIERAYEFATSQQLPVVYDAQYLALADRLGCDFWTLDLRLFNSVRKNLSWVKYVPNFGLPST